MIKINTSLGSISIELDHENAPISAGNVKHYAESGFYDGTIFHRVIKGFMVQTGGLTADMENKVATQPPITNEADNGLNNLRGTVAMARTADPHSATSQFFINLEDNAFLDHKSKTDGQLWGYAVFGQVKEGMDIVDKIAAIQTGQVGYYSDVPLESILINSCEVS